MGLNPSHGNPAFYAYSHTDSYGFDFTEAFYYGEEIGPAETYTNSDPVEIEFQDGSWLDGDWQYMPEYSGYAGFKFYSTIDSDWHYGWMNMKVDNEDDSATTLYGYAWETDPNTAIIAGDTGAPVPVPAAVWLLGSGLVGLAGIRRKRNA